MAITIAMTITESWFAMPTAVITESSENTMSRSDDLHERPTKRARAAALALDVVRLELLVDLASPCRQEEAAAQQDEVAPRKAVAQHSKAGGEPHDPGDREQAVRGA